MAVQESKDVLLTFAGAAFGASATFFLTYVGTRWIEAWRRSKRLADALPIASAELGDLRAKLAFVAYDATEASGTLDLEFIRWFSAEHEAMPANLQSDNVRKLLIMLNEGPEMVEFQNLKRAGIGSHFIAYQAPYLESQLGQLQGLTPETYRKLLDVHSQLNIFASHVESANSYQAMTFTLTGINHGIAVQNFAKARDVIGRRSKLLCEAIRKAQHAIQVEIVS